MIPEQYWSRLATIFGGGGGWTLGRRCTYNVIGMELLWQNLILGIGPGNFFDDFTDPDYRFLPGRPLPVRQVHNMYLSVAVEYGLVGPGVFLALILTCFFLRNESNKYTWLLPALAGAQCAGPPAAKSGRGPVAAIGVPKVDTG